MADAPSNVMSQKSITNFYGIRTHKRKFSADGEVRTEKFRLFQDPGTPEKAPLAIPSSPRRPAGVVAKLDFGDEEPRNVPFRKLSNLSPVKRNERPSISAEARRRLALDAVKAISKSSRLDELKSRLNRFNSEYARLEARKPPGGAALEEFRSIEVDVPVSPVKNPSPFVSPVKSVSLGSPAKSPAKAPAYQRFASLTATSSTLALPYNYRFLAEVFRAVDAACSLLHNRKETVTFSKIKTAARDMLKRNLTEKHLAQINHLCPNMYTFSWEKVKNFGSTSRREGYELILAPRIVDKITGSPVETMTPNVVVERQRSFYNLLVEKVKDHHEAFLKTLDPPMTIPRAEIKRWHPDFDTDSIPDVETEDLPKAPVVEKYSTARDVLSKAKEIFGNDPRVRRALEKLAEKKSEEKKDEAGGSIETVDVQMMNPALRGLPNALLLKVKARQAEKARQTMTRNVIENENSLRYRRLPDLARVLRNLFVTEKKCILPLETVVAKLDNSFSSKMSNGEMLTELKLLSSEAPEWLTFHNIRKTDYLKIAKSAEMTDVLTKLENLANKHSL